MSSETSWVGRAEQVLQLETLIDKAVNFPFIVVHGPPSSGKTTIVREVIDSSQAAHVYVPCRLVFTAKQFFDVILNGLRQYSSARQSSRQSTYRKQPTKKELYGSWRDHSTYTNCLSANTFGHIIQDENITNGTAFYIVLDHFEQLWQIDNTLLSSLVALIEIERLYRRVCRIGFVLIGGTPSLMSLKHYLGAKQASVITVHFPQYNNSQLIQILHASAKSTLSQIGVNASAQQTLIKMLVETFSLSTRRIDQFKQILAQLMPAIIRMVDGQSNHSGIDNNFIITMDKLHKSMSDSHLGMDFSQSTTFEVNSKRNTERIPDLPYAAKFLLLASYFASYNSKKFNEYQFTSTEKKQHRKIRKMAKCELTLMEKGPQTFSIGDLVGIFLALYEREGSKDARSVARNGALRNIHDLHSQIAHLISLSFLSKLGKDTVLDDIKLKCNLTHQYAHFLAGILRLRIGQYMEQSSATLFI